MGASIWRVAAVHAFYLAGFNLLNNNHASMISKTQSNLKTLAVRSLVLHTYFHRVLPHYHYCYWHRHCYRHHLRLAHLDSLDSVSLIAAAATVLLKNKYSLMTMAMMAMMSTMAMTHVCLKTSCLLHSPSPFVCSPLLASAGGQKAGSAASRIALSTFLPPLLARLARPVSL